MPTLCLKVVQVNPRENKQFFPQHFYNEKEEKYLIRVGKFLPSLINEEVKIKTIMWSLTAYHIGKEEKKRLIIFHVVQGI